MSEYNLMQQALGAQWEQLPGPLRAHYQAQANADVGELDIIYPKAMQPCLNALHLLGALINRRGKAIPTTVEKYMQGHVQHWKRTMQYPDGRSIVFRSHWVHAGGNRLIEFVNPLLGLCMAVRLEDSKLYYEGRYFVVKLGRLRLPLPEWLLLGHTTIVERAIDNSRFVIDFRMKHPVVGQIYRYTGEFRTDN
jgi:hypothetical protein